MNENSLKIESARKNVHKEFVVSDMMKMYIEMIKMFKMYIRSLGFVVSDLMKMYIEMIKMIKMLKMYIRSSGFVVSDFVYIFIMVKIAGKSDPNIAPRLADYLC
jgi:hypothetical protein